MCSTHTGDARRMLASAAVRDAVKFIFGFAIELVQRNVKETRVIQMRKERWRVNLRESVF